VKGVPRTYFVVTLFAEIGFSAVPILRTRVAWLSK
jgi:hypothetical protein